MTATDITDTLDKLQWIQWVIWVCVAGLWVLFAVLVWYRFTSASADSKSADPDDTPDRNEA